MSFDLSQKRSLLWLKHCFMSYYRNNIVEPPHRSGRREFGYIELGEKFFKRHLSFNNSVQLQTLVNGYDSGYGDVHVPGHVYHSVAYYRHPGAGTMEEKDWLGADLVFDLDADHLTNAESMTYAEQLGNVKVMVKRLVDDFLIRDLGFKKDDIIINFSGGRGYHIHYRDPRVLELDRSARQEIVKYITGKGLELDRLAPKKTIGVHNRGSRYERLEYTRTIPRPDEPGWNGRFTRGIIAFQDKITGMDRKSAVKYLKQFPGIGKARATKIYDELQGRREFLERGIIDFFSSMKTLELVLELSMTEAMVQVAGETDEPVTSDIKRLIRLPGSLHGKTGFRVLQVCDIDRFDPLIDAIAFNDTPVTVTATRSGVLPVNHDNITLTEGESSEVPLYNAVFAVARRMATIGV